MKPQANRSSRLTSAGIIILLLCFVAGAPAQVDGLSYSFNKKYGQVEVGGKAVGLKFFDSRPLPSCISFFSPVSNSVDLSAGNRTAPDSRPMALGVQVDNGPRRWIGRDGWAYTASPYAVAFTNRDGQLDYTIRYEFCTEVPGMIMTFVIHNRSAQPADLLVYSHLKPAIRLSHSYARLESAFTLFDPDYNYIAVNYPDTAAGSADFFIHCLGEDPVSWTANATDLAATDSGTSTWINPGTALGRQSLDDHRGIPLAAFEYHKNVPAGDSMVVIQSISCELPEDRREIASTVQKGWRKDINTYREYILGKVTETSFISGDNPIDRSVVWAKARISANQHIFGYQVVPMSSAADDPFFITRDALTSDFGVMNFDLPRVKGTLEFLLANTASDSIIPSARYYLTDEYRLDLCTSDDWTHLWYVMLNASYLRHSRDTSLCGRTYHCVVKSLQEVLSRRNADNLISSSHPDWWDVGGREGARVYPTVLAIRALRDFVYISATLGRSAPLLASYDSLADAMQQALNARLWDESLQYLVNYNDTAKDAHYYMGSLLAPVYGLLDAKRSAALVQTAGKQLLRNPLGMMAVSPADFSAPQTRELFKLNGDEAGEPYRSYNGGVWPQANAWYALALQSVGRPDEALKFVREMMTIDGILKSPDGIPAMYKYRMADPSSPDFGTMEQPSNTEAAAAYLDAVYRLAGFTDNAWNLSFNGAIPRQWKKISCSFFFGRLHTVTVKGTPGRLRALTVDKKSIPSMVLPIEMMGSENFTVEYGAPKQPYLESINAILYGAMYSQSTKTISLDLSSFDGHAAVARFIASSAPRRITLDDKALTDVSVTKEKDGARSISIRFTGASAHQTLKVQF